MKVGSGVVVGVPLTCSGFDVEIGTGVDVSTLVGDGGGAMVGAETAAVGLAVSDITHGGEGDVSASSVAGMAVIAGGNVVPLVANRV